MAGLEVEHVEDPGAALAAFSVARVDRGGAASERRPPARLPGGDQGRAEGDRLRRAERAGRALHRLCADRDLHPGQRHHAGAAAGARAWSPTACCARPRSSRPPRSRDGILELAEAPVGTPAAEALGLEAVIDFEVTPNRPDWLGVAGIARDLAAAGVGTLKDLSVAPVAGKFPYPIEIRARRLGRLPRVRRTGDPWAEERAVAGLDAGPAARHRPAPDQRPGRRDQLPLLRPRAAAARLRRGQAHRRLHRGAARARGRAGRGARRQDLRRDRRDVRDRRRLRRDRASAA